MAGCRRNAGHEGQVLVKQTIAGPVLQPEPNIAGKSNCYVLVKLGDVLITTTNCGACMVNWRIKLKPRYSLFVSLSLHHYGEAKTDIYFKFNNLVSSAVPVQAMPLMLVEDIVPGMHGIAKTVMKESISFIEEFNKRKVLGVSLVTMLWGHNILIKASG